MRSRILAYLLLGVVGVARSSAVPEVTFRTLPAETGVTVEMTTTVDAPAERVAQVVGDPHSFVELFPAVEAQIVGKQGDAQLVTVLMREPWPAGDVRWTETVARHRVSDGGAWRVEREALRGGFFRVMRAVWEMTPIPGDVRRCLVTYRVSMTLVRWAPNWALRRGQINGIRKSVERLRVMVAR